MQGGMKIRDFQPVSRFISEMMEDVAIVTMEDERETVPKLSNGTSFNDLGVTSNPDFHVTIVFNAK